MYWRLSSLCWVHGFRLSKWTCLLYVASRSGFAPTIVEIQLFVASTCLFLVCCFYDPWLPWWSSINWNCRLQTLDTWECGSLFLFCCWSRYLVRNNNPFGTMGWVDLWKVKTHRNSNRNRLSNERSFVLNDGKWKKSVIWNFVSFVC